MLLLADSEDVQTDLSHRWAHRSFCWFNQAFAQFVVDAIQGSVAEKYRKKSTEKSRVCLAHKH